MKPAVIVLYFNKINTTSECINSLLIRDLPFSRLFAISNGSEEKFYDQLKEKFPSVNHLHINDNRGFSGGFNRALEWVFSKGFDSALFLTNDTIVENDADEKLLRTSLATGAGLIAPVIRYYRKRDKIDSIAAFFDRERLTLSHYHITEVPVYLNKDDYIPGTALFITKDFFKRTGGMDESYNTYWDDADLSFRAHTLGLKQARNFDALIYHKVGQTCHKKPIYTTYYFHRNRVLFCKKFLRGEELLSALKKIGSEIDIMLENAITEKNKSKEMYLKKIKNLINENY